MDGAIEPQSNVDFDKILRFRDARHGIRDLRELKTIAKESGIKFQELINMPANNNICIWKKVNVHCSVKRIFRNKFVDKSLVY